MGQYWSAPPPSALPVLSVVGRGVPQNTNTAKDLENDPCDSSIHGAAIQSDLSLIATTIGGKLDANWKYTATSAQTFNC
jgi:hypothetical protein